MLIRTHLALSILAIILLLPYVNASDKTIFVVVFLISTYLPDIDTSYSKLGKHIIFRPLQFFVGHRGLIHSFTLLILITFAFVFVYPVVALPFFLGYGLHLLFDSFTIDGIRPFYPISKTVSWKIKTGGKIESTLFVVLIFGIVFFLLFKYTNII